MTSSRIQKSQPPIFVDTYLNRKKKEYAKSVVEKINTKSFSDKCDEEENVLTKAFRK